VVATDGAALPLGVGCSDASLSVMAAELMLLNRAIGSGVCLVGRRGAWAGLGALRGNRALGWPAEVLPALTVHAVHNVQSVMRPQHGLPTDINTVSSTYKGPFDH
jgi:hypothetical protein